MADEQPPPTETANISTPVDQNLDDTRSWEKSWSLEEMRKGSGNWSLAGDTGLLLHLQEFSQKMISRTHEIEKEVASLVHNAKLASVRVNNVFNDFVMLANTQFVENRVYDDNPEEVSQDETQEEKKENQEKSREEKEKELIPRVTEAIQLGVDVIEKAFEKLDTNVDNSDSEEEDESYRVDPILEAKDPYLDRPLPHLIGSPNFMNDDTVGLKDMSDEESEHDSYSESESEEEIEKKDNDKGDDSEYSYSDSESDSDTPAPRKTKVISQESDESDSDGDLFSDKPKDQEDSEESEDATDEEEEEEKPKVPPPQLDFASELARKLGGGAAPSPHTEGQDSSEEEEEKVEKKPKAKNKKKEKDRARKKSGSKPADKAPPRDDDDLFKQSDDSDDDLFGTKGKFGGGGSIFDKEDNYEGGLFDDDSPSKHKSQAEEKEKSEGRPKESKKRSRTTSSGKKVPAGAVALIPEEGGLFDDEEEGDMFSSSQKKAETKKANRVDPDQMAPIKAKVTSQEDKVRGGGGGGGLFEDEDEDVMFNTQKVPPTEKPATKKQLPAGAVSMFGPGPNPFTAALKKQQPDSDQDDENDWSDKSRSGSQTSNQSNRSKQSNKLDSAQSKDSLFTGDPDDMTITGKTKSNSFSKKAKATKGLFDEEDEEDLFSSATPKASQKKNENKPKPKSAMLFQDDDEEEGDLFSSMKAKPAEQEKKPLAGAVPIFPTGADPFSKKKETLAKEVKKEEEVMRRPPARSISLFDDDDDDKDEGLFKAGVSRQTPQKETKEVAKKTVFDDEGLFGEDDSGDIFSNTPSPPKPTTQPPFSKPDTRTSVTQIAKPKATKPALSQDLFGEGDENDDGPLFGSEVNQEVRPAGGVVEEKKRPVGGVSMFGPGGGKLLLPNKLKQGSKEKEVEKPKQDERKDVKTETSDPLFGKDDEDDLFTGSGKTESELPRKQEVKKISEKTPAKIGPLDLEDDDNDLFGVSSKQPYKQNVESLKQKSKIGQENIEKKNPLDLGDDDDGDLFSAPVKPSLTKVQTETPELKLNTQEEPVKKIPVGGVSMIRGMDPSAAKRKSATPNETSPENELFSAEDEKPKVTQPKLPGMPAAKGLAAAGKIGKLQASLNFNPAAMLPGAAPPVKEPEPLEIGFDVPAQARTLHSANKDRAKIQSKRRPPSRHSRKSAVAQSPVSPSDDFFSSPNAVSPDLDIDRSRVPPPLSEMTTDSPETSAGSLSSAGVSSLDIPDQMSPVSSKKVDLFGNEDLFGSDLNKSSVSKSKLPPVDTNSEETSDIFSSNAFTGNRLPTKVEDVDDLFSSPKLDKQPLASDNVFDAVPKTSTKVEDKAKTSENVAIPKSNKKASILDDDDDLLSSPSLHKTKDSVKKQDTKAAMEDDIFVDSSLKKGKESPKVIAAEKENDDLHTAKLEKKKPKKAMTKDEDLFEDDTDIFSDIPKVKPKEKKTKKKTTTAPKKTIFKDDIDDIFADTSASGKPKEKQKKKKKTATKDASEKVDPVDDIFSDPLS